MKKYYDLKNLIMYRQIIFILVIVSTIVIYSQVRKHEFINFDDNIYITQNNNVQKGLTKESVKWAFTNIEIMCWQPITWLSHMLDCQLFGLHAGYHHLTSVIIHLINTTLLFLLFNQFTGEYWKSLFVAALFALHPINVESVVWAAERKSILSTLFGLLTLISYCCYAKYSGWWRYLLSIIFFIFGLMSKPFLVTIPFILVLIDFWPLRRFGNKRKEKCETTLKITKDTHHLNKTVLFLILEKLPFFLILSCYLFFFFYFVPKVSGFITTTDVAFNLRVANAMTSFLKYGIMAVWPKSMGLYIPFPKSIPLLHSLGSTLILLAIFIFVFVKRKEYPFLLVGWCWFIGSLVPIIGLIQSGLWPAMAARWAYVPLIGLFIVISWGVHEIAGAFKFSRKFLVTVSMMMVLTFSIITWKQIGHWKNSFTILYHTLNVTTDNDQVHMSLGTGLMDKNRMEEAHYHLKEALRLNPTLYRVHYNLGLYYQKMSMFDEAKYHYKESIQINPKYTRAYINLGNVLMIKGKVNAAIDNYYRAIEINPKDKIGHYNLFYALIRNGAHEEALRIINEYLSRYPDDPRGNHAMGLVYFNTGKMDESIKYYKKAIDIDNQLEEAHFGLGKIYSILRNTKKGIFHYKQAIKIKPKKVDTRINLGNIYFSEHMYHKAILHYEYALKLEPDNLLTNRNMGAALFKIGEIERAEKVFKKSIELQPDDKNIQEILIRIKTLKNRK